MRPNGFLRRLQTAYNKPWGRRRARRELPDNPAQYVDRFAMERMAKYIPTLAEVDRIRAAAGGEFRLYLEILIETAARPSEALNLGWQDVTDNMLILYTKKTADGSMVSRKLTVSGGLMDQLQSWRRRQGPGSLYVFQQKDNEGVHQLGWPRKHHKAVCKRAEVQYFPVNCYRHFRASLWAREGVPLTTIQARLGHRQATTTNNYLRELQGT